MRDGRDLRRGGARVGLALAVLVLHASGAHADEGADVRARARLAAGVRALQASPSAPGASLSPEFQLYALGEALAASGRDVYADRFRSYLRAYYPKSPLAALLPADLGDALPLEYFDPDPEVARLVRTVYERFAASPAGAGPTDADTDLRLLELAAGESRMPLPPAGVIDLLDQGPDSPWAGWLSLQVLWARRLLLSDRSGGEGFAVWGAEHADHPLATEAREAASLRWAQPLALAQRSALLPGWGEDTLDPEAHEGASALYSELLLVAAAAAFTVSAQGDHRVENLAAALAMYNLLFLNHSGSAETAYAAAVRYNLGQRRKFLTARRERPVLGAGRFVLPAAVLAPPAAPAWSVQLSVSYRQTGAGDALRGTNWVREDELANLGVRGEVRARLAELASEPGFGLSLSAAPYVRGFTTHARPAEGSPLAQGASVSELGAGVEAVLLASVGGDEGAWRVRLSCGPGLRWRSLNAPPATYAETRTVGTAQVALGSAGPAASWQLGLAVDEGFVPGEVEVLGLRRAVPSLGWEVFGGLEVNF